MDFEVFEGLAAAADEIAAKERDEVLVVVVSGEGRSFSSGIDLSALGGVAGEMEDTIARAQAGFRKIAALPMPTIARVQGHALGAGLQLALACDLRVVATDAVLGLLETKYGLIPDLGGSTRLPQLVGTGRAKKMIWLAEKITGEEAGSIGLAEVVVTPDELERAADELAERLAAAPITPVREAKLLIEAAPRVNQSDGMDAEARAQMRCMTDPNFGATLTSGLQRRS
jgi:enoyl-CoA hydratase/carnithine racemase